MTYKFSNVTEIYSTNCDVLKNVKKKRTIENFALEIFHGYLTDEQIQKRLDKMSDKEQQYFESLRVIY